MEGGDKEYWEYQSDSEPEEDKEFYVRDGRRPRGVVVQTVKRSRVNLAAAPTHKRRDVPQPPDAESEDCVVAYDHTIYAHDSEDEEWGNSAESAGYSQRVDRSGVSAVSSVYSTSIMEFLSPEPERRGAAQQASSRSRERADGREGEGSGSSEDSNDELIIIRPGGSSAGFRRGESQTMQNAPSPMQHQHQSQPAMHGIPSRSLFEGEAAERPPSLPLRSSPGQHRGHVHSSPTPGNDGERPHRVVLELDDLEL